jgi:hypothetical protein
MNAIELARIAIQKLKGKTKFETMLGTVSILTTLLDETGLKAIIVGGFAVEIYTRSEYTTVDKPVFIGNLLLIVNGDIGFF